MAQKTEKLGDKAMVKGTMVEAHLIWAGERLGDVASRIGSQITADSAQLVTQGVLASEWYPFRCLVEFDRAVAGACGGVHEDTYREMGRQSAVRNLGGVYKGFVAEEPHRFFEQMALLHGRFQNFGHARYRRTGERSGEVAMEDYPEYSPVYCASAVGYYEGALQMMKVPGPIRVRETACQCAGEPACVFALAW